METERKVGPSWKKESSKFKETEEFWTQIVKTKFDLKQVFEAYKEQLN